LATDPGNVIEDRVRSALDSLTAPFEIIECDPSLADTAAFCAHYGYPPDQSANTILVASKRPKGSFAACVVLSTMRLDVNNRVCTLMGVRKASFASPEVTAEITGMMIGGVTPFALPSTVPLYVDAAVIDPDWVILGGGSRSMKVKIDPQALIDVGGQVISELGRPT
jgi:prolyl-tRNA editing enzyme YbaK/EbsC (Cys-tRNA(Pro) deacylase)